MSTTKDIADDYYIKRLNNAEIFEKHKLSRKKSHISQERVFEYLPTYKHKALHCSYCDAEMESRYVSKSAGLIIDELSVNDNFSSKDLQKKELVRVEIVHRRINHLWSKSRTSYIVDGGH